ncbi:hypothetical protein FHS19_007024 [Paenibacillus rhizosphaerae]|uniref:Uncharacterized protein n=1 Tax=Paenibacillus rhizosphaerae TaxID=297318 RepID=A0A839TZJ1_9BACL|nr:hypothetical protein [Paenibacillus rhizosphaerae]
MYNKFKISPDSELIYLYKVHQIRIKDKAELLMNSHCPDLEMQIEYHTDDLMKIKYELILRGIDFKSLH